MDDSPINWKKNEENIIKGGLISDGIFNLTHFQSQLPSIVYERNHYFGLGSISKPKLANTITLTETTF